MTEVVAEPGMVLGGSTRILEGKVWVVIVSAVRGAVFLGKGEERTILLARGDLCLGDLLCRV